MAERATSEMVEREELLRAHWHSFCDADPVPEDFIEAMEGAGLAELVDVDDDALDDPFASERGIIPDGMMWQLTDRGRAALSEEPAA